jgi:hypothetical protein
VLTTDTEAPVVTETTVSADLLQALKVVTELGVDTVGKGLAVLAIDDIALPVEEPAGDLVCDVLDDIPCKRVSQHTLRRVLDDGDDTLKLFRGEVTGALAEIDIGLLADQVGVAATDTLDLGQGVHDLLLSIDVCVQQTDDVLEAARRQHCDSTFSSHTSSCHHRRSPAITCTINPHEAAFQSGSMLYCDITTFTSFSHRGLVASSQLSIVDDCPSMLPGSE